MRNLTLAFVLTATFSVSAGAPVARAASIMAPVRAGLQTCAAQIGGFIHTDYQPELKASCCTMGDRCGVLLNTVEPRAKAPKRT